MEPQTISATSYRSQLICRPLGPIQFTRRPPRQFTGLLDFPTVQRAMQRFRAKQSTIQPHTATSGIRPKSSNPLFFDLLEEPDGLEKSVSQLLNRGGSVE